jgi:hypothetical protein
MSNDPNPYAPPQEAGLGQVHGEHKQRGGCLTAFLVLMFIANPITALFYLFGTEILHKGLPNAPEWMFPVLAVLASAQLVCAIGMWTWRKWGVYGSFTLAALGFVINLAMGINPMQAFMGLGGPIILAVLIKPIWRGFR